MSPFAFSNFFKYSNLVYFLKFINIPLNNAINGFPKWSWNNKS